MPSASYCDYANVMLALPSTASQLARKLCLTADSCRLILRSFQSLRLVSQTHKSGAGKNSEWVWSPGPGPIKSRGSRLKPKTQHIGFAYLWREFESGATVFGAGEDSGASKSSAQRLIKHLRSKGAVYVCGWERDARGSYVAAWRIGDRQSVPKPIRSKAQRSRDNRLSKSANVLRTVWMTA